MTDKPMAATSLGHMPNEKWAFDDSVTQVFDDMLQRSIPAYASMRELTEWIGARMLAVRDGLGHVVDLGCSRGAAVAPLVKAFPRARFTLCDVSEPMLAAARARFGANPEVEILRFDLRTDGFPVGAGTASLVYSVLTLQFVPIEHRLRILRAAYDALDRGGALVLVEKVIGATADVDQLFVDRYYAHKREMGYTQEEIDRKRLALEGVMVPLTARWNEEMLRAAGFTDVDCFWRWANFAGWLAVRA